MKAYPHFGRAVLLIVATCTVAVVLAFLSMTALHAAQSPKSPAAAPGNAENGKRLFASYGCYECHGREGQGSVGTGPRLAPDPISFEAFTSYVRKPKREMPPYTAKVVSEQDLTDIYAFLASRPHPPAAKTIPALN
jgi:ubiquinol-cytochrome c reductase cytochrome c subunit